MNPSGGLACFGEAVPAQAIAQVCELTWQLRGQADGRQVEGATRRAHRQPGPVRPRLVRDRARESDQRTDTMAEAYIVDAVRTPVGRRGGGLVAGPPGRPRRARRSTALVDRTGIDPVAVEDVIFGCVDTIGPQAGDIARTCWLAAGLPEEVPGTTDRPPVRLGAAGGALRRAGA